LSENIRKRALITGGTRGIGRAIVKEFASRKINGEPFADILFIYNSCDECAVELIKELEPTGANVFSMQADVSSFEESDLAVKTAVEKLGGIDFLINNAGITRDNLLLRMSEEDYDKVLDTNLKSVFNFTKAVIRPMMKQKYGRIVNISSVVGMIGYAGQANYAASKAGIFGFTKSIAKELGSRNITCNAVSPGFIETEMTEKLNEQQKETLMNNIPVKRLGKSEDIAKVVAFLCSTDADYITGQVIAVDGGMVM